MAVPDDPWDIAPEALSACRSDAERWQVLCAWAVLAPSSHNSQPWLFRARGRQLELLADRRRALPVVDPAGRELVISCGAALGVMLIAARALGQGLEVAPLPDPAEPDLLARLSLGAALPPPADAAQILAAIKARRTTRRPFPAEALPMDAIFAADDAALAAGATLRWLITPRDRYLAAELIAEADRIQMADPAFRAELAHWVRSRHAPSRDGMSGEAVGVPDILSALGALAIRSFDLGAGQAARDQALAEGSPALAVLTTPGDAAADWLAAGRALAEVLITLQRAGLTASYLNQPIEVPGLRPRLAAMLGSEEAPQLLLRVGRGPALPPTARRPVAEVLVHA
ncbi:MAG: hypothetical protein N2588_06360 [Rhodovarius sp.]|nr:hypothetical protein [Rhodovarius sp.]